MAWREVLGDGPSTRRYRTRSEAAHMRPFLLNKTGMGSVPLRTARIGPAALGKNGLGIPLLCMHKPPFASVGSGPDRPVLGLFKSSSGTLGMWHGQHEAHFAGRGPIGHLFRCCSNGSAGVLLCRQAR